MKIGSLFAGIGGLELGLERAGVGHTVWQVERDPFCQQVLARHWPDATRYDDVTTVDWSTVEPVEVLCGGFPCQDLSYAGKGAGLAGERSGLWREYVRAVRALRPRFVVVENVPALLSRGMGVVLGDLAACGYDAEWDCVPAAAVGAPHRRDRVFVVAYPDGEGQPVEPVDGDTGQGVVVPRHVAHTDMPGRGERRRAEPVRAQQPAAERSREDVADARSLGRLGRPSVEGVGRQTAERGEAGRHTGDGGRSLDGHTWAAEPDVGGSPDGLSPWLDGSWGHGVARTATGVPRRVDRLRALGNAVVPQVAEAVGRRVVELAS